MKTTRQYFLGSYVVAFFGLFAGIYVGYIYSNTWQGALTAGFLTVILGILEISLSFDNAVVNASVLKDMSPVWRQRFLTWGILIAVFGMRVIFPLAIVSVVAHIGPWEALMLAATRPDEYARIMMSSHLSIAGFGGSFLLMVAFAYFFNREKHVHWLNIIEKPLVQLGKIEAVALGMCLLVIYALSRSVSTEAEQLTFITSSIFGMLTFVAVDGLSSFLKMSNEETKSVQKSGAAMFIYLEVLDASFSFDGVIGALAITNNIFLIAIGLGVGAMFLRSMTIYLVDKGTLNQFIYLEHGAFYAIGALAIMMLLDVFVHVPEVLTGLIGAVLIGLSVWSSVQHSRQLEVKR